jgi:hypothetical protein
MQLPRAEKLKRSEKLSLQAREILYAPEFIETLWDIVERYQLTKEQDYLLSEELISTILGAQTLGAMRNTCNANLPGLKPEIITRLLDEVTQKLIQPIQQVSGINQTTTTQRPTNPRSASENRQYPPSRPATIQPEATRALEKPLPHQASATSRPKSPAATTSQPPQSQQPSYQPTTTPQSLAAQVAQFQARKREREEKERTERMQGSDTSVSSPVPPPPVTQPKPPIPPQTTPAPRPPAPLPCPIATSSQQNFVSRPPAPPAPPQRVRETDPYHEPLN